MPAGLIATYIVTACAMITAAAATGCVAYLRNMASTVEKNEDRSVQNSEILTGEPEHIDGVLNRLDRVEDQVGVTAD
jgi:hypothetical protein